MKIPSPLVSALVAGFCFLTPAVPAFAQTDTDAAKSIPAEIMLRAAERAYRRDLSRARAGGALDVDRRRLSELRSALNPLVVGARELRPDATNWQWEISLETRDDPVAYCLPGGKILVTTGFVDRARLTSAEQVAVVAHAIAHALAGHDAEEAEARLQSTGRSSSTDPNRIVLNLAEVLAKIVASEPHAISSERVADALALELMARSGIDPRASVEAWRKIARAGGATPPGFLSLHPTSSERLAELEGRLPEMVAIYEATLRDQPAAPLLPIVPVLPSAIPARR